MADFDVKVQSGAELAPWVDEPTDTDPSRLNPAGARQPLFWKVAPGAVVVLEAVVDGVVAPADVDLDGRLFVSGWAEWSAPFPPSYTTGVGQSSSVTIQFDEAHAGLFAFSMWREGGGAVVVRMSVEP